MGKGSVADLLATLHDRWSDASSPISVASRAAADEVTRWNQIATGASTVVDTNPLKESCIFSILHVTIHNAVNAVESRYEPYQSGISPTPGGSVEAAIASTAHDTLVVLLPASKVTFDAAMEETLGTISDDSRKAGHHPQVLELL
jgi:hypothetical protein